MSILNNNPTIQNIINTINNDLTTTTYVDNNLITKIDSDNINNIIVLEENQITVTTGETSLTTGYLLLLYKTPITS